MIEEFKGILFGGHKEDAVEVPFDPARKWEIPSQKLREGRNGHFVKGTINGIQFESAIVPRMRKSFLLIDNDVKAAAKSATGDTVKVAIEPLAASSLLKQ